MGGEHARMHCSSHRKQRKRWVNKGTHLHFEWDADEVLSVVRLLTRGAAEECSSREVAIALGENDTNATARSAGMVLTRLWREGLVQRRKMNGFSLWRPIKEARKLPLSEK